MGLYLETQVTLGKAVEIVTTYPSARFIATPTEFNVPEGQSLLCVVNNGLFNAAGICYDEYEFRAFSDPDDKRKKRWLLMDSDELVAALVAQGNPIESLTKYGFAKKV
jgi:hypothetical protein